jgi:hypothetical protein
VIRRLRELWLKTAISMYGPGDQKFAIVDGTVDRYDRAYAIRGWIAPRVSSSASCIPTERSSSP